MVSRKFTIYALIIVRPHNLHGLLRITQDYIGLLMDSSNGGRGLLVRGTWITRMFDALGARTGMLLREGEGSLAAFREEQGYLAY